MNNPLMTIIFLRNLRLLTYSCKSQQKNDLKTLFWFTFFPIEIGTLSPIISLKYAEFLDLAGIVVLGVE